MNAEIKEYFHLLKEVCRAEYPSLGIAYRQLRGLLEHLCRTQQIIENEIIMARSQHYIIK
jgi:hypothetical protein